MIAKETSRTTRPIRLRLLLAMTVVGACLPGVQAMREPAPWMARVLLSERLPAHADPSAGFDAAVKSLTTPAALGRAVALLGLDKDRDFNGGNATALSVALELLRGQGAEGTDALSRATARLAALVRVDHPAAARGAVLLVKAATPEKAARIAEALAAVFTAPTDITGPVPTPAARDAQAALAKASSDLMAFRSATGNEALADVLVARSRIDGLFDHIARLKQETAPAADPLAAVSLSDLLAGRVNTTATDARLSTPLDAWQRAKLSYDQLAGALGPKHPQLLAAAAAVEDARQAVGAALLRAKQTARLSHADAKRQIASLEKSRAELVAVVSQSGIDLARYDVLSNALEAAKSASANEAAQPTPVPGPILEASGVEPLAAPRTWALPIRMALGGLSGFGAALAFALGWRGHGREDRSALAHPRQEPQSEAVTVQPATPEMSDASASRPDRILPVADHSVPAPHPVQRQHLAANAVLDANGVPGDPLMILDDDLVLIEPAAETPAQTMDAIRQGDLPTMLTLHRATTRVVADAEEDAEVQRLRQELADLRSRILRRSQGGR